MTPKSVGPSTTNAQPSPTPAPVTPNRPTQAATFKPSQTTTKLPLSTQTGTSCFIHPDIIICPCLLLFIANSHKPNHNLKTPEIPQHDILLKFVKTVTIIIIFSLDDHYNNVKVSKPSSSTPWALYIVVPLGECLNKQSKDMLCYET